MRATALLLAGLLVASAAWAQDEPAPAPPAEEPAVATRGVEGFPLDPGRRWTYKVDFAIQPIEGAAPTEEEPTDQGAHRLDVYVANPLQVGDRLAAAVEWKLDQDLAQRSFFVVEDGYLRCVRRLQGFAEHVKEFVLTPAQPVLPEKLEVGQSWTWTGKVGADDGKQTSSVLRIEQLETPAGTFTAFVVETTFEAEDDSSGTLTRWIVPGVGIVKEVNEARSARQIFRVQGVLVRFEKP